MMSVNTDGATLSTKMEGRQPIIYAHDTFLFLVGVPCPYLGGTGRRWCQGLRMLLGQASRPA